MKTHKYRIYPNKTQEKELMHWMRVMCDVYCILVDYKSRLWESSGRNAKEKDLRVMFYSLREYEPEIYDLPQALFTVMIKFRIMPAYRSFFALIKKYRDDNESLNGRPQTIDIKSHNNWAILKRNRYESGSREYAKDLPKRAFDSMQFGADPNNRHAWIDCKRDGLKEINKLHLSKFKSGGIKTRIHRPIDGDLRFIVIKREYDKWYACCCIDDETPVPKIPKNRREVGIDLGINKVVTTSDGKKYPQIQAYTRYASKLNELNSIRSRKEFGSHSQRKIRREIGRTWEHIRNTRNSISDQIVHDLIENYDVIYHEDINISGLLSRKDEKGRRKAINKRLSDQIWGTILRKLSEKIAGIPGKKLIPVPSHYTSQLCSRCYHIQKMPLYKRSYKCPRCGLEIDRDINAAKNILNFGRNELCLFIARERWKERHAVAAD
jgi:transposase